MTFFEPAVGGGEEMGRVRPDGGGAGGCFAAAAARGRVEAALWVRAGFGAGVTSLGSAAARVTRSARDDCFGAGAASSCFSAFATSFSAFAASRGFSALT